MAKIMYWMGDTQSGVEQIGHTFSMLLAKLGHDVTVFMTQDVNTEKSLSEKTKDFDVIVYNEGYPHVFNRIRPQHNMKEFNICHGTTTEAPLNVVHLCLNPYLAIRYNHMNPNIKIPLTYPFYNSKIIPSLKEYPLHKYLYVGRYNDYKFPIKTRNDFKEMKITMDAIINGPDEIPKEDLSLFDNVYRNLPIPEVYKIMSDHSVLLIPSVTECLSLVAGEGLAIGMDVLAVEQCVIGVYRQFDPYLNIASPDPRQLVKYQFAGMARDDFNETSKERKIQQRDFMRKSFSLDKTLYTLDLLFGHDHKKGSYEIYSHYAASEVEKRLEFTNARYLTSMEDNTYVARSF